jgi:hypothetical protein
MEGHAVIIGAGPTGLSAALYLSYGGMRVTVVDRLSDSAYNRYHEICGAGISRKAFRKLSFIEPTDVRNLIEFGEIAFPGDITVRIPVRGYVLDRVAFLHRLKERCKENGCEFRNADYVLWSRRPVPDVTALMLEHRDEIENVNFVFRTLELLEEARAKVCAIENANVTSSFMSNLEVGGPNTSKKTALLWLMDKLGISTDELMCCGDAPNDMAMLELAGIGVAVANAWGGLKDHADYITASNDDDGVALAIEKFVLKR